MLKLGNQGIKALYVGGQKITKAYVGEELVYKEPAKPSHNLPADYTELEYIQIGVVSKRTSISLSSARADQIVTLDFEVVQFPNVTNLSNGSIVPSIMSCTNSSTTPASLRNAVYLLNDGLYANASATSLSSKKGVLLSSDVTIPQRFQLVWNGLDNCVSVNGNSDKLFSSINTMGTWSLGTGYSNQVSTTAWNDACIRLYSAKIDGSNTAYNRNCVPAKDSSGKAGFYDLLNDKFLSSSAIIAGPAV